MPKLTSVKIEKVYTANSKPDAQKEWTRYDFYIEGNPDKFAIFASQKNIVPTVGMNVAFMEWDETQSGEYVNRTVSALHTADELKTPTDSEPAQGSNNIARPGKPDGNPKTKYIDHGKSMIDLMNMSIREGGIDKTLLMENLDFFRRGCEYINKPIAKKAPEPKPIEEPQLEKPTPINDDDIPF